MILTMRLKVKAEAYPWLNAAAIEVNQVWNYCNATSFAAITRTDKLRKFLTGFDLCKLTAGATECFARINADIIQSVCVHFAQKRRAAKLKKLRWRVSAGSRRSLGWIPIKATIIKKRGNAMRFAGKTFRVFESDLLDGVKWRAGCFAQDAIGQWWLCLPVEVQLEQTAAHREIVGIDLGLKATATTSDGDTLEAGKFYREIEPKLAQAQRRGHKRQAKRLHLKAKNRRADALHKFSRKIVNQYQNIVIGDVSSTKLAKTRMAKSVLDAGWGMLKDMLDYKSRQAARTFSVVNEAYTSRACSACGSLSGPRGVNGLRVRAWACVDCGAVHDRDVNAARNIANLGSSRPTSVCGNEPAPMVMV